MKRPAVLAITIAAALASLSAVPVFAAREVLQVGNLYLADNGGISPSRLPKHGSAPVTARLIGEIGTVDGSHPPALRTVALDIDRAIGVNAVGLPVCAARQITATTTATAKRTCGGALVGSGEAEVEVEFAEQPAFTAKGPVLLFNGGVHGATTLVVLHAYVAVPAPTAIVVTAKLTRIHRGRYGLHILAQIPRIAGGAGSVTNFKLKVGRRFTYQGKRQSYLTASCPTGQWATQGKVLFDDGTRLGHTHVFPCTPVG